MQSYLNQYNLKSNLFPKLIYTLKNKKIKFNIDNYVLDFEVSNSNQKYIFKVFHSNLIPSFVLGHELEDIEVMNKIEGINLDIEDYGQMEDIIYELHNFISNMKIINKKYIKNQETFRKELERKKESHIILQKEFKKSIFSLRTNVEMLGDQILKIYNDNNFFVSIKNFPNIKVYMENFTLKNAEDLKIKINMVIDLNLIKEPPKIIIKSNKELKDRIFNVIENLKPLTDKNFWSVRYSLYDTLTSIHNMINIFGQIVSTSKTVFDNLINELEYLFSLKTNVISETKLLEIFDRELIKNNTTDEKKYWKQGTGYGHNSIETWNIEEYITTLNNKKQTITHKMTALFSEKMSDLDSDEIYTRLIDIFILYIEHVETSETLNNYNEYTINIRNVIEFINQNNDYFKYNISNSKVNKLILSLKNYSDINNLNFNFIEKNKTIILAKNVFTKKLDNFQRIFENKEFNYYDKKFISHYYHDVKDNPVGEQLYRLKKEFNIIKKSISITKEASIFFMVERDNIMLMRYIISGPMNTPYAYGLYIFDMTIPSTYPSKPPLVQFYNNGGKRFNPNLYNNGKVCLSLLGTWNGDKGESWNSTTSTMFQILISIQSLILIEEPYYNEPGYEKLIGKQTGIDNSKKYNEDIRLYNLNYTINNLIDDVKKGGIPEFNFIIREYFKFHRNDMITLFTKWLNEYNNMELKQEFQKSLEKFISSSKDL